MDKFDFSLSEFAKHTLSWMVMTELLKLAEGNNSVTVSFPGGGLYDCLTLRNEDEELVLLNRLGDNALANSEVIENIWTRAARDPREAALHIMAESELDAVLEPMVSVDTISAAAKIAKFLSLDRSESARATWAVTQFDGSEEMALELEEFVIPEIWRNFEPAAGCQTWASWIWILEISGEPVALINLKDGEIVSPERWDRSLLGFVPVKDEEGLPAVAVGYQLVPTQGKNSPYSQVVRPSLARGMQRIANEEGDEVDLTPLRRLSSAEDVETVWAPLHPNA